MCGRFIVNHVGTPTRISSALVLNGHKNKIEKQSKKIWIKQADCNRNLHKFANLSTLNPFHSPAAAGMVAKFGHFPFALAAVHRHDTKIAKFLVATHIEHAQFCLQQLGHFFFLIFRFTI